MFGFGVGVQRLGSVAVNTLAELNALPAPASGVRPTGIVLNDSDPAKNGLYAWSGSAWSKSRALPDQVAKLTVSGGTANAITATAQAGIDPANTLVALLIPSSANTGAVTLNGKPVRDKSGNALASGALTAGMMYVLADLGTEYRVMVNNFASIGDVSGLQAALDAKASNDALSAKFDTANVDASASLSANSDTKVASQKATKSYIDAAVTALKGGVSASFDTLAKLAANFGNYLPLTGGAISGSLTVGGSAVVTASNIGSYAPAPDLSPYALKAGGTFTGALAIQTTAPVLSFLESDQTLPAGQRRFILDGNIFTLRRNTAAGGGFTTEVNDLTVSATGDLTALGNITAYSDERLKENIRAIEGALGMINRLYGARFDWNEKAKSLGKSDAPDIGVIAQNVAVVLPEAVKADQQGNLTVAYEKLIPVLIEAVKELSARVKELEGR